MQELLESAARRSIAYLNEIQERAVTPSPAAVTALSTLDEAFPEQPCRAEDVLQKLDEIVSPATIASAGPRFYGFVIGGSLPVSLAANWLAGAWDQNAALYNVTPGVAILEQVALRWLTEFFGFPAGTGGGFVTGATMANFSALTAARHTVLERAGWNVEANGLFGAPEITVVVGAEAHTTLFKALGLAGFGRNRVVKVPVDGQGRMIASAFPQIAGPAIVCLQAGNVNSGAFDPFEEIMPRAHAAGAWVHVDGAFGLWGLTLPELADQTRGMQAADSWATDAHKWLNVPYDSGLAFVRNPDALRAAMSVTAEYLPSDSPYRNPSDFAPELSRRARGVEVWAVLRSLGRAGVTEMISRCCRHARRFAQGLKDAGFEVLNDVVLNQVLASFGDAESTKRVIAGIQTDGTCWCGGTVWQGHTAMRISVSSWATTDEDVERSLEAMIRVAREETRSGQYEAGGQR